MHIFISTSFTNKVQPDGSVEPTYRAHLEAIISTLEARGHTVFCALKEDDWQLNNVAPGEAFLMDADAVRNCDIVLGLIRNNPVSAGIQFELGVAYALGKRIALLWQAEDLPVPYINQGLLENKDVKSASYQSLADVPKLIDQLLG